MRWKNKKGPPLLAPFDLLICLLMVFVILALVEKPKAQPPRINTHGTYAITVLWPNKLHDDIDLYVRDPLNQICYYGSLQIGQMQLEHDDLGTTFSSYGNHQPHYERIVIRGIVSGEYTANIHVYYRNDQKTVPVLVQLWRLQGEDKLILQRTLHMHQQGDEQTAFRWTLNSAGDPSQFNRLPRSMVYATGSDTSIAPDHP